MHEEIVKQLHELGDLGRGDGVAIMTIRTKTNERRPTMIEVSVNTAGGKLEIQADTIADALLLAKKRFGK